MERRFAMEGPGGCRSFAIEAALDRAAKDVLDQKNEARKWLKVFPELGAPYLEYLRNKFGSDIVAPGLGGLYYQGWTGLLSEAELEKFIRQIQEFLQRSFPGPERYRHIPSTPQEELQRSQGIVAFFKPGQPPLTIGDLSLVTERARKERERSAQRHVQGDTVGDLSVIEPDHRGLDELYAGPKSIQPSQSESQHLAADKIRKDRERREKVFKIRQLLAEGSG